MSSPNSLWQCSGLQAHLATSTASVAVQLESPGLDLTIKDPAGSYQQHLQLIRVKIPHRAVAWDELKPLVDNYTRGTDLVATYSETAGHPLRVQIYWRILSDSNCLGPDCFGIEVLLATQTHLLDCDPSLEIASMVPQVSESFSIAPEGSVLSTTQDSEFGSGCLLARLADSDYSYLEMAYPGDVGSCSVLQPAKDQVEVRRTVFAQPLEKGVILQSRFRSFVLPRDRDVEIAGNLFRDFAKAKPALTT